MTTMTTKTVGEQLKEARIAKGLSQLAVEKEVGLSRGTLSKYEHDKLICPPDRLDAIYDVLGLGAEKIADFFSFKETKTPEPVQDDSPDKFGPSKNHEGYSDPTMAAALSKITIKYTDHMPGEVWTHKRRSGAVVRKVILSLVDKNKAICASVFANGSALDFKVKTKSGNTNYVNFDKLEVIYLRELEERTDILTEKCFENIRNRLLELLDIKPIEKEVIKEVPVEVEKEVIKEVPVEVEKEVIKEVPVEVEKEVIKEVPVEVDDTELQLIKQQLAIYKDLVDRLLPPRLDRRCTNAEEPGYSA